MLFLPFFTVITRPSPWKQSLFSKIYSSLLPFLILSVLEDTFLLAALQETQDFLSLIRNISNVSFTPHYLFKKCLLPSLFMYLFLLVHVLFVPQSSLLCQNGRTQRTSYLVLLPECSPISKVKHQRSGDLQNRCLGI